MSKPQRSKADLEAELKQLKRQRKSSQIATVLTLLINWSGVLVLGYFTYLSIDTLSGSQTQAELALNVMSNIEFDRLAAYVFGTGGVFYGYRQRKLRHTTVERVQARIAKLEGTLDPGRTSSGLTPRGQTHPKDM